MTIENNVIPYKIKTRSVFCKTTDRVQATVFIIEWTKAYFDMVYNIDFIVVITLK